MVNSKKFLLISILILSLFSGCNLKGSLEPTQPSEMKDTVSTTETLSSTESSPTQEEVVDLQKNWWTDAVFYEIFVRSFNDSNGDGIGDFQGIIQKLDYLNDGDPETDSDLGITAIWLMPINPSPSYHGYDITNYLAVNPDYGTMEDFKQLLSEAHRRGIHVIMDFVINHTSDKNPWFVEAKNVDSGFHDWYVWSEKKPAALGPWGANAWFQASNGLYYYAIFWSGMPDLNFKNAQVNTTLFNTTRFWLDTVGVDGFRVDAARYLYGEFGMQQDTEETITWFKSWREVVKGTNPDAFTVGEVWTDVKTQSRYGGGTGLDSLFIFDLSEVLIGSVFAPVPLRIIGAYQDAIYYFPDQQFSTFLTNHDQQRVMSFFGGNVDKAKISAFIYLTGPGIPFLYYGEEIGMTGSKPDEFIRTPMQWSGGSNAGFSSGKPWEAVNADYLNFNVADEEADPDSLLNLYKDIIKLRNDHIALRTGEYLPLETSCQQLYPILRVEDYEVILSIVNIGRRQMENCTLSIGASPQNGTYEGELLFGRGDLGSIKFNPDGSLENFLIPFNFEPGQMAVFELHAK